MAPRPPAGRLAGLNRAMTMQAAPQYRDGEFVPTRDVPFSDELDQLIAEIRKGEAPNLGRFCGRCCAPLGDADSCRTCGEPVGATEPVGKIDRELAAIYTAKRKREGLFVHLAAWTGILLATALSVLLIYFFAEAGIWVVALGLLILIAGGYFAGVFFGNVLIQDRAYRSGLEMFARRWCEYRDGRDS